MQYVVPMGCNCCPATVSEHTMLLEGACSHPLPTGDKSGPVSGVEIMRKLSKSHTHSESALKIKVKVCLSTHLSALSTLTYIIIIL